MDKKQALDAARLLTETTKRKHVVRNAGFSDAPDYIVTPLYELGREGRAYDAGYSGLGAIVEESMRDD